MGIGKKYKVINDLEDFPLKHNDGGLYAILPYDRLDKNGNGLFKVGQADSFARRFENYHTYYPLGMYYDNLLANPTAERIVDKNGKPIKPIEPQINTNKRGKDGKFVKKIVEVKQKKKGISLPIKTYYNKIERFIHNDIKDHGGKQLISTTRIKNEKANKEKGIIGGDTEWFYTNEKTLDNAFKSAHEKFEGKLMPPQSLAGINKEAMEKKREGNIYKAEIYYKIPK